MKLLAIAVSLLVMTNVIAQNAKMTVGNQITNQPKGTDISEMIGVDDEGSIYVLREKAAVFSDSYLDQKIELSLTNGDIQGAFTNTLSLKKYDYFIEKYDKDSKLRFSKQIDFPMIDGKGLNFNEFHFVDGEIVGLASRFEKTKDGKFLKAYKFNISTEGQLDNGTVKEIGKIFAFSKMYAGDFDYVFSPDKSKILVYGSPGIYGGKMTAAKAKRFVAVYDNQFKLIWKKKFSFPHVEKTFFVTDKKVDNNGNVTFSGKKIEKGQDPKVFAYYSDKSAELKEFKMSIDGKVVNTASTYFNTNSNELVVAGFFGQKGKSMNKPTGFYYKTVDLGTGEVKKEGSQTIGADVLAKIEEGKSISDDVSVKPGTRTLDVREFFPFGNNGEITMIAQMRNYYWKKGNIVVVKVNGSGNVSALEVIACEINGNMQSVNRRLHYIPVYNETSDNLYIVKYKGRLIQDPVHAISISKTGEVSDVDLFSAAKNTNEYLLEPLINCSTKDNEVKVFLRQKQGVAATVKSFKFGTITVE